MNVAKAKIDIKNDLKDIRVNIIRKEPRKYHVFKGIFKGNIKNPTYKIIQFCSGIVIYSVCNFL
jgi:hypothetical protein